MPNLWERPGSTLLRKQQCAWCLRPGIYNDGTQCKHGEPPRACALHGRWTDLNLVARGKRAVVKCTHYGVAFVVLYADPIADDKEHGTYTIQFGMTGVGSEVYTIPAQRLMCPHMVYDEVVRDMLKGARPSQNRVPNPQDNTATPGGDLNGKT